MTEVHLTCIVGGVRLLHSLTMYSNIMEGTMLEWP